MNAQQHAMDYQTRSNQLGFDNAAIDEVGELRAQLSIKDARIAELEKLAERLITDLDDALSAMPVVTQSDNVKYHVARKHIRDAQGV